jgi:hypothetical protein
MHNAFRMGSLLRHRMVIPSGAIFRPLVGGFFLGTPSLFRGLYRLDDARCSAGAVHDLAVASEGLLAVSSGA